MDRPPKEEGIRNVSINDLDDDILKRVMKKLTMYERVVNSRISKRFNRYVAAIDIDDISLSNALKLVERFPNLTAIYGGYWQYEAEELNDFIEKVAMINHKLQYISVSLDVHLLYVMTVKGMDPDYTASRFEHALSFKEYEEAVSKYPDLDLKFYFEGTTEQISPHFNPKKVIDMTLQVNSQARALEMLSNAIRLTHLEISISWRDEFFKLKNLLQVISRLPLKSFIMSVGYIMKLGKSEIYNWTRDDLFAIKQVFQIPSIDVCRLDIHEWWTQGVRDVFQAYMDSDRDKMMELDLKSWEGQLFEANLSSAWIRFDNPEQFPFASFLDKYEMNDGIIELNLIDVEEQSKKSIVATCTAFAEQNPNRSFNLLFHVRSTRWVADDEGYQFSENVEEEDDFYKFNQNSRTVQRHDREDLLDFGYMNLK